ncbi:AIPR family protein [Cohnella zeiphila]|uniref:AIPR family protein n=1 Tax=Cohnella zeiphila TaxID=2761120 RepID=A0A7X0VXI0_9BACL|nr:AIPR family protein [Cohnella zeiphila]MBB6734046.1 AIPR family protein [Cohnella zeiphila]
MDAQEFRKDFMENVRAEAAATGEGSCASFVSSFAGYLEGAEVLLDFTASYFEGTGKRNRKLRVDGYAFDEFDKTMSLVIADFDSSDRENVITRTQATQLQERLVYFVDQSLNSSLHSEIEMSRACSDLVDLLREKRAIIRKYQLLIFTTSTMSSAIKALDITEIDGVPVECQIWDLERLFKVCGSDTGRSIIEIDFKEYTASGIPCIEASDTATDDFKSYLCIIPGILLADIYDRYGSSLLEGNVRSFLSTKVAVNKKIRTTILQCPERFFAYNNGIAATALNIKTEITSQGTFLVGAADFQIINGGQTTASLSNARHKDKADLSSIFVQMKLTVIERSLADEATELMQNISRSSNSQNKVSDADFFSTHPFHVRMEQFSQRLFARATGGSQFDTKWFYERARGQYLQKQMRLTPSEKKKFLLQNPKSQLVTKTDLAKVRNSWKCLPHIVSRGAQTNFAAFAESTDKDWAETDNGLIFNERYWQESVALMLLFRYTERMVSHQPWYTQSYRANIVTYTIALLHKLIAAQYPDMNLDLASIWARQSVPSPIALALTSLSELVYNKLTDQSRKVENVTQWCKREECWKSVSIIYFDLPSEIKTCLIDKEEKKIAEREAKSDQRMLSGVEIQTKVCTEIAPDQWNAVMKFAMSKRMITPDESTALRIACQIPLKIPTPAQSKKLLEVLERVQEEGFKL